MTTTTSTTSRRRLTTVVVGLVLMALAATLLATAGPARAQGPAALVRVTVVAPDGTPVPEMFTGYRGLRVQRTDAQGVLVLQVDTSWQWVCAYPDPESPLGGPTGWGESCTAVTPVAASTTRVRIVMHAGAAFGGTVRDARTGGPVAGAKLTQVLASPDPWPVTFTDDRGRYRFRSMDVGRYDLETLAVGGPATATARWGYVDRYPAGTGILTLTTGRVIGGIDVTLVPNVRVTGTVTGPGGGVVAGADIAVRLDADHVVRVRTNTRGNYLVIVPWDSAGPVCASAAPGTAFPGGLTRQCRAGLFEQGIEVRADFALTAGT